MHLWSNLTNKNLRVGLSGIPYLVDRDRPNDVQQRPHSFWHRFPIAYETVRVLIKVGAQSAFGVEEEDERQIANTSTENFDHAWNLKRIWIILLNALGS